jgi:hypothetical protein
VFTTTTTKTGRIHDISNDKTNSENDSTKKNETNDVAIHAVSIDRTILKKGLNPWRSSEDDHDDANDDGKSNSLEKKQQKQANNSISIVNSKIKRRSFCPPDGYYFNTSTAFNVPRMGHKNQTKIVRHMSLIVELKGQIG